MTNPNGTRKGGRPPGIVRLTRCNTGCYSKKMQPIDIYNFWRKHRPGNAMCVNTITARFLRYLGWTPDHERAKEVQTLAIRIVSRDLLFLMILEMDFTRPVKKPGTELIVTYRASDQFLTLRHMDDEIDRRLKNLGLMPAYNSKKSRKKSKEGDR